MKSAVADENQRRLPDWFWDRDPARFCDGQVFRSSLPRIA